METQVVETQPAVVVDDGLREQARRFYSQMQTSWFLFGKAISKIKETGVYKKYGKDSFKDFCIDEFPSMHFSTICKTIKVADSWGEEIEDKLESDPDYRLPAYESCYTLTTAEKELTKSEFQKLRKNVLEGSFGYMALRNKLKSIILKKRNKITAKEVEEIEDQLIDELKQDEEFQNDESNLQKDVEDEGRKCLSLISQLKVRTEYMQDKIPTLGLMLESNPDLLTTEMANLGHELDDLVNKVTDFLKQLEDM